MKYSRSDFFPDDFPWELRIGDFRVFYDVDQAAELVVIVAVGEKQHNTLKIGGEEFEL